jgi:hypothetical protein
MEKEDRFIESIQDRNVPCAVKDSKEARPSSKNLVKWAPGILKLHSLPLIVKLLFLTRYLFASVSVSACTLVSRVVEKDLGRRISRRPNFVVMPRPPSQWADVLMSDGRRVRHS